MFFVWQDHVWVLQRIWFSCILKKIKLRLWSSLDSQSREPSQPVEEQVKRKKDERNLADKQVVEGEMKHKSENPSYWNSRGFLWSAVCEDKLMTTLYGRRPDRRADRPEQVWRAGKRRARQDFSTVVTVRETLAKNPLKTPKHCVNSRQ